MTYELDSEEVTINATAEVKPDDVVRMNHPDKGAKGKDKRAGMGKGDNWKWAWKPGTSKGPLDLLLGGGETEDFLDRRGTKKEDVNINDDKQGFTMNMDKETDNDVDMGAREIKDGRNNNKYKRPGPRDLFKMIRLKPLEDKCCANDQKMGKVVSCIVVVLNPNIFKNMTAGFVVNGIPFSYSGPNGNGRSYFIYKGEPTYQFMNGFNGDKYKFGKAVISNSVNLPHIADFRMGSDSGSGFTDFSVEKCQNSLFVFKQIEYVKEDKELTTTPATVTSIDIENIFRLFKKRQCIMAYNKKLTDQGIEALTKAETQNFRECKDDLIELIDNLKNMDFQGFLDHLDELEDYIDELDDQDNHTDEIAAHIAHFNEGNKSNILYLFGTIYFHTSGSNSMRTEANISDESKFKFIQGKDKVVGMIEMEEMMDEMSREDNNEDNKRKNFNGEQG